MRFAVELRGDSTTQGPRQRGGGVAAVKAVWQLRRGMCCVIKPAFDDDTRVVQFRRQGTAIA